MNIMTSLKALRRLPSIIKKQSEIVKQFKTKEKEDPTIKYSQEQIQNSKYPNEVCGICGQKGCDELQINKAEKVYVHKDCSIRLIDELVIYYNKNGFPLTRELVQQKLTIQKDMEDK